MNEPLVTLELLAAALYGLAHTHQDNDLCDTLMALSQIAHDARCKVQS